MSQRHHHHTAVMCCICIYTTGCNTRSVTALLVPAAVTPSRNPHRSARWRLTGQTPARTLSVTCVGQTLSSWHRHLDDTSFPIKHPPPLFTALFLLQFKIIVLFVTYKFFFFYLTTALLLKHKTSLCGSLVSLCCALRWSESLRVWKRKSCRLF